MKNLIFSLPLLLIFMGTAAQNKPTILFSPKSLQYYKGTHDEIYFVYGDNRYTFSESNGEIIATRVGNSIVAYLTDYDWQIFIEDFYLKKTDVRMNVKYFSDKFVLAIMVDNGNFICFEKGKDIDIFHIKNGTLVGGGHWTYWKDKFGRDIRIHSLQYNKPPYSLIYINTSGYDYDFGNDE